jgi:hypothetical protein
MGSTTAAVNAVQCAAAPEPEGALAEVLSGGDVVAPVAESPPPPPPPPQAASSEAASSAPIVILILFVLMVCGSGTS